MQIDELSMTEFRRGAGEYLNQTHYTGKTYLLKKADKPVAALVPISTLERLAELEAFHDAVVREQELVAGGPQADETGGSAVE